MNKTFIIAEIGINHNGDMNLAMQLSEVMKGGAAVEIDIGTLNATLAKNNLDNTFEMLKLAKVSEPVQKSILTHAANLLGYNATFDNNGVLQMTSGKTPLNQDQQKKLINKGIKMKKIRSKHNNLLNYFICNREDLSKEYVRKSEKFLKEISDKLKKESKKERKENG